jgi:ech hydrogenase subunit B
MKSFILSLLFIVLAPLIGGLLAGLDRIFSARMQGRVGPPLFQPFYDVLKLLQKENIVVRRSQNFYIGFFLLFTIFMGCLFFNGGDLLLVIFATTLASIFFVLAAYKASSPYSFIGAERELILMMAEEPVIPLGAVGMYMVTGSFKVLSIATWTDFPLALHLPGLLIGFILVLIVKMKKSPFDLSFSHHGHQELVKGMTTEFSGRALAAIEVTHWYETVFILGFIYLFFANNPIIGVAATLFAYFLAVFIDNTFARVKWQWALKSIWIVTLLFGFGNLIVLSILSKLTR